MGLGDGGGQRIAELTSFMSAYRQCWALSLVPENSAVSAPLTQAFLSLPADSYRRGRHDFEDRHDHLLVSYRAQIIVRIVLIWTYHNTEDLFNAAILTIVF